MKIMYIVLIVIVVGLAMFLIIRNKELKLQAEKPTKPTMTLNIQEQKAYDIAWAELTKHFKDGEIRGVSYKLIHIIKSPDTENVYHLTFTPENRMTDSEIWISVDVSVGIVTKYQKAEA
ncbi:MAG: hypothetical protein V4519_05345 [Patescibacteria group bacterium]